MLKEKGNHIDEEETVRAFVKFRSLPADEQIYALAFISGMSFQKSISEAGNLMARERVEKDAESVC